MNDNEKPGPDGPAPASEAAARGGRCPTCGKPTAPDYRPFCSKRCADIDLNRWLSGVYAVPGKSTEEEADEEA